MKYIAIALLLAAFATQSGCLLVGSAIYHDQKKAGLIGQPTCTSNQCVE